MTMRKLFWSQMVTLDGFMAGPNGELDWHTIGADFMRYVDAMGKTLGTIVFGRVTYEMMASFWPGSDQPEAPMMNETPKLVFSRTLKEVTWQGSRLATRDVVEEIRALKASPPPAAGKTDIGVFGSANLAATLMKHDLIDEYRIFVNPILLGRGLPTFADAGRKRLELTHVERHEVGTMALCYRPATK